MSAFNFIYTSGMHKNEGESKTSETSKLDDLTSHRIPSSSD